MAIPLFFVDFQSARISVYFPGLHIAGDFAGLISLIEGRNHIRIKLGADTFIDYFNDHIVRHFLAVGAIGSHCIVDIGHR